MLKIRHWLSCRLSSFQVIFHPNSSMKFQHIITQFPRDKLLFLSPIHGILYILPWTFLPWIITRITVHFLPKRSNTCWFSSSSRRQEDTFSCCPRPPGLVLRLISALSGCKGSHKANFRIVKASLNRKLTNHQAHPEIDEFSILLQRPGNPEGWEKLKYKEKPEQIRWVKESENAHPSKKQKHLVHRNTHTVLKKYRLLRHQFYSFWMQKVFLSHKWNMHAAIFFSD